MELQRCAKTEAGRAEIQSRSRALSRPARNLLLVVDTSRTLAEWVTQVRGATLADAEQLHAEGLIAPTEAAAARPRPRDGLDPAEIVDALCRLEQPQLYELLTRQAKASLGLIKGFKTVLEVEHCSNLAELQALATRFVATVVEAQGVEGLRPLQRELAKALATA